MFKTEEVKRMAEIIKEGYAGGMPGSGMLVDRREHPEAIPIQENQMLSAPKPKPLPDASSGDTAR